MFNESWRRPVWQIRWATCWVRHRELWRRRRRWLKPEAQSRADQHLRQPVAKLCKSLSPFLSPLSAFSLFPLSPSHHILSKYPTLICSPSLTLSLTLPLHRLVVWANGHGKMSAQANVSDKDAQAEPTANSYSPVLDVTPGPQTWTGLLPMC